MIDALERCRAAEKEQALFYRGMAVAAAQGGYDTLADRFHDLHADEQHHLSRITARLIELGHVPADLSGDRPPNVPLDEWEQAARARELEEVARYTALLAESLDAPTRALVEEILGVERHHAAELGGKWTPA